MRILSGCVMAAMAICSGCSSSDSSTKPGSGSNSDASGIVRTRKGAGKRVISAEIERSTQVASNLAVLQKHAELRELVLIQCGRIRAEDIERMKSLPKLAAVEIVNCSIDEPAAAGLGKLPNLRRLTFAATPLSAEVLQQLESCRKLETLSLRVSGFDRAALKGLRSVKQLKHLTIDREKFDLEQLTVLRHLPQLQSLHLPASQLSAGDIKSLPQLPALRELRFNSRSMTDAAAGHYHKFPKLESLDWSGSKITDNGLTVLAYLPQLKSLKVTSCRGITNNALPHLLQLPAIKELHLIDTGITAAGFLQLVKLKTLKKVVIRRGLVDAKQLEAFQKALPSCEVVQLKRPPKLG